MIIMDDIVPALFVFVFLFVTGFALIFVLVPVSFQREKQCIRAQMLRPGFCFPEEEREQAGHLKKLGDSAVVDGGRDFVGANHLGERRAQENHNGRTIQRKIKKLAGEKWNNMTVLQISLARVSIFASKFSLFFSIRYFP